MTSENRTLIELSDIAGVEFECPKCGTKVLYPMEKSDRLADKCPNCFEPWLENDPSARPGGQTISERIQRTFASFRGIATSAEVKAKVKVWIKI